jgi:hypothetical protein
MSSKSKQYIKIPQKKQNNKQQNLYQNNTQQNLYQNITQQNNTQQTQITENSDNKIMDSKIFVDLDKFVEDEMSFLNIIFNNVEKKLSLDENPNSVIYISGINGHFDEKTNLPLLTYKSSLRYGCFQTFFSKMDLVEGIFRIISETRKKTKIDIVAIVSLLDTKYFFPPENEESENLYGELIFSINHLVSGLKSSGITIVTKSYVELVSENYHFINLENMETPSYTFKELDEVDVDLLVFFPPINGFYKEKYDLTTKIKSKYIIDEYTLVRGTSPKENFIGYSIDVDKKIYDYTFIPPFYENPPKSDRITHLFGIFEQNK